jgi:hypothetical protein
MAAPSNIRINPFIGDGGTTNYVNFIEKHIVPAVSPFVIRLNEVPEKQDPSNIKVEYIDGNATGEPTGVTLTEVAATPGAGEYRLDYSTNAVGDKEWNTGLIEFSSSDATNVVQISYTGTGTLAGVKNNRFPSWWLDRGDSSDGDFVPTGNTTISGVKQYRSVVIRSGVTVTISGYAIIKCQGVFINHGTITASGQGAHGGSGGYYAKDATGEYYPSAAGAGASAISGVGGAGGSNHGAAGAGGGCTAFNVPLNGPSVIELTMSLRGFGFGAGGGGCGFSNISRYSGGAGGRGGGAIAIVSTSIYNSGIIAANGANGYSTGNDKGSGGGGGGGGMVAMIADTIMNYGSVTAAGGAGGSGRTSGAAGGTGIVFIKELGVM